MARDFIHLVSVLFIYQDDSQKAYFMNKPYTFVEHITTYLASEIAIASNQNAQLINNTILPCLRMLGDLTSASDTLCSYLIQSEHLNFLPTMHQILLNCRTDERCAAVWMLSNCVINSTEDCAKVLDSGIMSIVGQFCR